MDMLQVDTTPGIDNVIEKFTFATDANSSDVGDLTQARRYGADNQG